MAPLTALARLGAGLRLLVTVGVFLSPHALMRFLAPSRRRGAWGALLGLYVSWYVSCRPVPTGPPNATPTDAEVVAVLHKWLREMRRLFDEHKDCLPPDAAARGLSVTIRSHL